MEIYRPWKKFESIPKSPLGGINITPVEWYCPNKSADTWTLTTSPFCSLTSTFLKLKENIQILYMHVHTSMIYEICGILQKFVDSIGRAEAKSYFDIFTQNIWGKLQKEIILESLLVKKPQQFHYIIFH